MPRQYSEKELMSPIPMDEQKYLADLAAAVSQLPESGDVERDVYMDFRRAAFALEEFYLNRRCEAVVDDYFFNRTRC